VSPRTGPRDDEAAEGTLVLNIPAVPTSAAYVRRALADLLEPCSGSADFGETAALLVTELVTNAARHAGGDLRLRADLHDHTLLVEVTDVNATLPVLAPAPGWDSESGRGLLLIDALADRWGSETDPPGKCVWFELSVA